LREIAEILGECENDFHRCKRCDYQDDDATRESNLFLLLKDRVPPSGDVRQAGIKPGPSEPSPPADRREIVARIINTKVGSKSDPNFVERRWLTGVDEAADAILAALAQSEEKKL
jgi:hypothetical protein